MSHSCMLSFYSRFLIINTEANYWKILHIKINHVHDIIAEKWCSRFHQSYMLLCRIDTCFSFLFIKYVIGVWTTDLFWEIFSTPKFIGCFKIKTFPNNITVLENMSDGHISILENRKKVCYKHNITVFPWNTFLLEGKIVWYNQQHYPHIKKESNGYNMNVHLT